MMVCEKKLLSLLLLSFPRSLATETLDLTR